MTNAPERIWVQDADPSECDYVGGGWWDDECGNAQYDHVVEYIRADIHDALVKAADEVARLLNDEADCYAEFDKGRIEMKKALTAYHKAKEKLDA